MSFFRRIAEFFGVRNKEANLVIVGLDNSGKSTILNHLKVPEAKCHDIVPTVGFNVEKVQLSQDKKLTFTCFDMSGQGRYRNLWEAYYKECDGILFVIDSSDKLRFSVAKEELQLLKDNPDIQNKRIPILFFANKMDLRDSYSGVQVSKVMELEFIKDKPWHITATNALTGEGIEEGMLWLSEQINANAKK